MKKNPIISLAVVCATIFLALSITLVSAQDDYVCVVYFTGIGCPHCAKTDPVLFGPLLEEYPNLVIIEYEIYRNSENAPLLSEYNSIYDSGLGIPLVIFGRGKSIIGDTPILQNIRQEIGNSNECPLVNGFSVDFKNLDITALPGQPKIWKGERILISAGGGNNTILRKLLTSENLSDALNGINFSIVEPKDVELSGRSLRFQNAISIDGWILEWNGDPFMKRCHCPEPSRWSECKDGKKSRTNYRCSEETGYQCVPYEERRDCNQTPVTDKPEEDLTQEDLTLAKIISLAAVDAVNPCAIAVLTLVLIAIISYNPEKRRNVLLAGFAFVLSVYIIYMFYGLVIIRFFQLVRTLTSIKLVLYKVLGLVAVALGLLNIKDYIRYKPGGVLTEMPMRLRPRVKKIIEGIISPKGAFLVGAFVTVFLLPCTIGPYVIAGGILSTIDLLQTIPWLMFYNLIFVLPMIAVTVFVYFGFTTVENVSGWKEKNIRYLHLIAGLVMLMLGIAMFFGLV